MPSIEPFPPNTRLLAIAPHPDDESLAMGGLLQAAVSAGAPIRILFLTGGDNNPWPQRLIEHRWRITPDDQERWAERRRGELRRALASLGVAETDTIQLGLPDQGLTPLLRAGGGVLLERFATELADWRPTLVAAPSPLDLHPDHSAAAVLLRIALSRPRPDAAPPALIEYLIHPGNTASAKGVTLRLPLSPERRHRKREAILCHESQVKYRAWHQLAHAAGDEIFYPAAALDRAVHETLDSAPASFHNSQSQISNLKFDNGELHLKFALGTHLQSFGQAKLLLFASRQGRPAALGEAFLPRRAESTRMTLTRYAEGGQDQVEVRIAGRYRHAAVAFPLAPLGTFDRLFIKVERRFGFFDEAGWLPLQNFKSQI